MKKIGIISLSIALVCAMTTTGYAAGYPTGGSRTPNYNGYQVYIQNGSNINDIKDFIYDKIQGNLDCDINDILNSFPQWSGSQNPDCDIPDFEKPDCDYPSDNNPDSGKPDIEKPDIEKPEIEKPEAEKPEAEKPEVDRPIIDKPNTDKPNTDKPVIDKPETEKPENNNPSGDLTAEQYISEVVRLVNIERVKAGLGELTADAKIAAAAYVRSTEQQQLFSHTRPNGTSCFTALTEQGVSYRGAGENIAFGQRTPEEVMTGWMNSPGHRANILNKNFTKIGVGYYKVNGTAYWTQLFTY